jgi:hypothetical protein
MQENIRFAYQILTRAVHLTGYRSAPNVRAAGEGGIFAGGNIALEGTSDNVNGSDTFTVRYQGSGAPDGSIVDCSGAEIRFDTIVTNVFAIRTGRNGNLALWCDSSISGSIEIVPDVQSMHILYGDDTDAPDADYVADRYVQRGDVVDMNNVVAVRIALLFQTANAGSRNDLDRGVYQLNGVAVGPFNDTRVRRLVTWNLNIRNRTP